MRSLFPILAMLVLLGCDPAGVRYVPDLQDISDLQDVTDSSETYIQDLWAEMGEIGEVSALDVAYVPPDHVEFVFLDVGQGDSILVRFPGGATMLVDGGSKAMGKAVILPYMEQLHLWHLDLVMVTHPDADHCGGLDDVVLAVDVDEVWKNGQTADTWAKLDFSDAVDERGVDRLIVERGYERTIDGCAVRVLNADEGWDDTNGNSVVLSIDCDGLRGLLTGDVGAAAQDELMAAVGEELPSQIVKVPHHGSADQDPMFAQAVAPEVAVCSVGEDNGDGHPSADAIEAWEEAGAEFIRTNEVGTVTISGNGEHLSVETEW